MVTFETKCYENDWEFILKGSYLQQMIARCNYRFAKRTVLINNVNDIEKVRHYAEKMVRKHVIDEYYLVDDYAQKVLEHFDISLSSFNGGYYYSIAELTGILLCSTPYLLHFSSDTMPDNSRSPWIKDAIAVFEERQDVIAANPVWNFNYAEAKEESIDSLRNFYLGYGFSDQCYLVKTACFKQRIYNEKHPLSERYPQYGGELFEKRVDSYMRNHQLYRITSMNASYVHENFPKNKQERFRRKLKILLNRG